jgi:hypothetical protein
MSRDSEALVQSKLRLEAAGTGMRLWRNNVGVLLNRDGRPVRYGLANDSKALNEKLKSGDLIGWRRRLITPADVGHVIAQFVSRECKPAGWTPAAPSNVGLYAHEQAQRAWIDLIAADGGDASFYTGEPTP